MKVNNQVKFANGLKGTVVEVWENGTYVVEPNYPTNSIIPFGATRLTMNEKTGMPYGYSTSYGFLVMDVVPARKTKAMRKAKNSNLPVKN